jgi:hypothetical protein
LSDRGLEHLQNRSALAGVVKRHVEAARIAAVPLRQSVEKRAVADAVLHVVDRHRLAPVEELVELEGQERVSRDGMFHCSPTG